MEFESIGNGTIPDHLLTTTLDAVKAITPVAVGVGEMYVVIYPGSNKFIANVYQCDLGRPQVNMIATKVYISPKTGEAYGARTLGLKRIVKSNDLFNTIQLRNRYYCRIWHTPPGDACLQRQGLTADLIEEWGRYRGAPSKTGMLATLREDTCKVFTCEARAVGDEFFCSTHLDLLDNHNVSPERAMSLLDTCRQIYLLSDEELKSPTATSRFSLGCFYGLLKSGTISHAHDQSDTHHSPDTKHE